MPDYSEFPTTPTAWQERALQDAWQGVQPLPTEDPTVPPRRRVDRVALVPGIVFSVLAIVLMTGVDVPLGLFRDGGVLWVLLTGAGVWLLLKELRKARRTR